MRQDESSPRSLPGSASEGPRAAQCPSGEGAAPKAPRRSCRYADLHIHTTASDGCLPPAEVVELAFREGFTAISICDHDTVAGLPEAIAAAERVGLELIPGLELSSYLGKSEVHILGYCLDYEDPSLAAVLNRLCAERRKRIKEMTRLLGRLKVKLDSSKMEQAAAFGSVGRMHLARALVEQGFVGDVREAFARYIGHGKPAYVPRAHVTPAEACSVITRARGIPVLAHPSTLDNDRLIPRLVKQGILGIEAFYPSRGGATAETAEHYCRLAEEWGLLITGGSDCHQSPACTASGTLGPEDKPFLMGTVKLDYKYVEMLKEKAAESIPPERQA